MNIKCFLIGHDSKRMMAFDDSGVAKLQRPTKGDVIPYLPVMWCKRCGKLSGHGFLGKRDDL